LAWRRAFRAWAKAEAASRLRSFHPHRPPTTLRSENPARTLQKVPVDALRQVWQDGIAKAESEKQFSVTRAASSTSGRAKKQILIRQPQNCPPARGPFLAVRSSIGQRGRALLAGWRVKLSSPPCNLPLTIAIPPCAKFLRFFALNTRSLFDRIFSNVKHIGELGEFHISSLLSTPLESIPGNQI
jgi:hypothetical protein